MKASEHFEILNQVGKQTRSQLERYRKQRQRVLNTLNAYLKMLEDKDEKRRVNLLHALKKIKNLLY